MAICRNKVEWRSNHLGYTWCQNGVGMDFSAPPALLGKPEVMTPEDAFMAAANTCYHMMVIWAMERFKFDLVSFECAGIRGSRGIHGPDFMVQKGDPLSQGGGKGEAQESGQARPRHGTQVFDDPSVAQIRGDHQSDDLNPIEGVSVGATIIR